MQRDFIIPVKREPAVYAPTKQKTQQQQKGTQQLKQWKLL